MLNKRIQNLLMGSNLWYLGEGMLGPLLAVFTERVVGGSILDITWAWAIYQTVQGVLMIYFGKLSDSKVCKELLMVLGYGFNALFTFAYIFVSSPWHLFLVQAGLGFAASLASPTWSALYARHEDPRHDGYSWGLAFGQTNLVLAVAILIGGSIIYYLDFAILFVLMGCIQVVATLYQARILLWAKDRCLFVKPKDCHYE